MFPAMIADLIRASAPDIRSFRFPSGDKGQVRGFDGNLVATGLPPYVPDGRSIWEFGVSKGAAKAERDYAKRLAEVDAEERQQTTIVLASPCAWNDAGTKVEDWVNEKKSKGEWKDVVFLDGTQIENWLHERPAVAAYYARYELVCAPRTGARSLQEFWTEFSSRFQPELVEEVLVCEREDQCISLLQNFGMPSGSTVVSGDAPDEVIAFTTAAIRKADPEIRLFLESRALVIDTEEAANFFAGRSGLIFLPRGQARQFAGLLAKSSPTLIATGRDPSARSQIVLRRPSTQGLGKAIAAMGIPEDEAYQHARSCGRSLTCLSRLIPSVPGAAPPWIHQGRTLIPALFAGAWDATSDADKEVLSELAGRPYTDIEADLRPLARLDDAPVDREANIWKIRAPLDAFIRLGHLVGPDDLERFQAAATTVFSRIEAPPNPDELFRPEGMRPGEHSSWLRDGLATTLLLIAAYSREADLVIPGQSAQEYVNGIIRDLPGLASDHRLLASLKRELPLLMEAAPDPLLAALERLLEGDGSAIRPIFAEIDHILAPDSAHTGLLWALEMLAWDPDRLPRVAYALARLAAIDPGGRLGNRPIESLREIFVTWAPQTNASLVQRLAALDQIVAQVPNVAWDLMVRLLPKPHDAITPTAKPRFREAGASERERLTYSVVWQAQHEVIARVLTLAGDNPKRWVTVINSLSNFDPPSRSRALRLLGDFFARTPGEARLHVWSALRDETNRNLAFPDAKWALSGDELAKLQALVKQYEPADVISQISWLFDDWMPSIPGNIEHEQEPIDQARRVAIERALESHGIQGVLDLADQVKLPQLVALSVVDAAPGPQLCEDMLVQATIGSARDVGPFAISISGAAADRWGAAWRERFSSLVKRGAWVGESVASLCLGWPDGEQTWSFVRELGPDIERNYWTRKSARPLRGDTVELCEAARLYLQFGRAIAAMDATFNRAKELPTDLLLTLLDVAVAELNQKDASPNTLFLHHLEKILDELESRPQIPRREIAKREYAYLPLLQRRDRTLSLHREMRDSPDFYVSIIVDAFKPATQPDAALPPTDRDRSRGRAAYRLLSSFKLVPGATNDGLDFDVLRQWIDRVRQKARELDRAVIADQCVGQVLAHSPADPHDGAWPIEAVRRVVEQLQSDEIERGIHIERINMRGVYWKALYEGGKQERALAEQTLEWARASDRYPRMAALLRRIAADWAHQGEQEDIRARQDEMRSE